MELTGLEPSSSTSIATVTRAKPQNDAPGVRLDRT